VTPVGSNRTTPLDIRVIAATNLPHDRLRDEAVFRQDLLFRLNTVEIELPPLRNRRDDIPMLLAHFLQLYERRYNAPARTLPEPLARTLTDYDWPGNIRALRHACERAVILAEGSAYRVEDFPMPRSERLSMLVATAPADEDLNLERAERQMVERALQKAGYNISLAATELGLTRAALYRRMEKYGL
jgi:DNA-binding NtrC family response regulator